jgi:phage FluMu gp28-like protein
MVTESGAIRFDAPRTVDGHADRAWSLALALHACSKQVGGVTETGPGDHEGTL